MSFHIIKRYVCDVCHSTTTIDRGDSQDPKPPLLWAHITDSTTDPGGHDQTSEYDVCDKCVEKIIKSRTGGAK